MSSPSRHGSAVYCSGKGPFSLLRVSGNTCLTPLTGSQSGMEELGVALGGGILTFGFFPVLDKFFSLGVLNGHRPLNNA